MTTHADIPLERTRKHWARAGEYPADKERVYPAHAEAQEFELARGKTVLEYGCGGGSDTMSYLRRGARVHYVDIVPSNVDATCSRILETFGILRGRETENAIGGTLSKSAELYLGAGTMDIVSSHGVLHHIVDPAPVLREFHRVLKPEGKLYVMLYTEHLEQKCERRIGPMMARHKITREEAFAWCTDEEGAPYARSYTAEQGTELLEGCGFKVTSTFLYANADFRTFRAVRA